MGFAASVSDHPNPCTGARPSTMVPKKATTSSHAQEIDWLWRKHTRGARYTREAHANGILEAVCGSNDKARTCDVSHPVAVPAVLAGRRQVLQLAGRSLDLLAIGAGAVWVNVVCCGDGGRSGRERSR
jgi:hypothetical protein